MTAESSPALVSVALATCNGARFLAAQLDSIYAQTLTDIEVVASDDGSDDDTVAILSRYAASHGLRLFRNPRRLGVKANFEAALRQCRGRYVALADQDDIWHPHKLARCLDRLRESGASLVYSDARLVDANGNDLGRGLRETLELVYLRGQPHDAFYLFNCVTGCSTLFERELLARALPIPAGVVMHDWWLAWVATLANGIDFIDEPLLDYRQHAGNQLGAKPPRRLAGVADAALELLDVAGALHRLRRLREQHARRATHLAACRGLEQTLGRDTRLLDALMDWNRDYGERLWLGRHRRTFAGNPALFALLPAGKHRRLLRHRLLSIPLLMLLVGAQALGVTLLAAAGVLGLATLLA